MAGLQWVNAARGRFGGKGAFDLTSPEAVARLGDNGPATREVRRVVANSFRRYDVDAWSPKPWPWLYGDAMNVPPVESERQNVQISDTQLALLDKWADGEFEADYDPSAIAPTRIEDVPLAEQGEMLTRAALDFCLADAFHPGCEMTWPVRSSSMYMQPFRFLHAKPGWSRRPWARSSPRIRLTIPNGPLTAQSRVRSRADGGAVADRHASAARYTATTSLSAELWPGGCPTRSAPKITGS